MKKFNVENCNEGKLISDIMQESISVIQAQYNIVPKNEKYKEQLYTKDIGGILLSFTISVSASVFVEVVKYCINKYKQRYDFDENAIIVINGKKYTLKEVEKQ